MRRAQSVRHHTRPSLALASDDLGMLREGTESDEDVLRKQLIEKDRECDKLSAAVHALQAQLAQRPPIEDVQAIQKEYKNLELILQGTQRENERCMAELERSKQREKLLESKLRELAGENWQSSLDIAPAPTSAIKIGGRHQRSNTVTTLSGIHGSPSPGGRREPSESEVLSSSQQSRRSQKAEQGDQDSAAQKQALFAHIENVKLLVLGMEQRLQTREDKLTKTIEKAEKETFLSSIQKLPARVNTLLDSPPLHRTIHLAQPALHPPLIVLLRSLLQNRRISPSMQAQHRPPNHNHTWGPLLARTLQRLDDILQRARDDSLIRTRRPLDDCHRRILRVRSPLPPSRRLRVRQRSHDLGQPCNAP
ncbi:hypothetical protein NMY22_g18475 [Coprinellus aureogranulatus]|nr:hypothetical protein NMY22_g18475 [Coprinellus aureogranulatus]